MTRKHHVCTKLFIISHIIYYASLNELDQIIQSNELLFKRIPTNNYNLL